MRPERVALVVQVRDGLWPARSCCRLHLALGYPARAAWLSLSMDLLWVRKLQGPTHEERGKRLTLQEGPCFVNPISPEGVSLV